MKHAELVDRFATEASLQKTEATRLLQAIVQVMTEAAVAGDEVSLPGYGKLKVQHRAARTARNPRSGQSVAVPASRKVSFQPAKALRDRLAL